MDKMLQDNSHRTRPKMLSTNYFQIESYMLFETLQFMPTVNRKFSPEVLNLIWQFSSQNAFAIISFGNKWKY